MKINLRAFPYKLIAAVFALVWLFVVLVNYYIVHKPFDAEQFLRILSNAGDVLVAVLVYALAATVGRWILRGYKFATPLERMIFSAGVGLGALSLVTFILGLVGALNGIVFWAIILWVFFLLRNDWRGVWCDLRAIRFPCDSRFEFILRAFILITLILAGLVAFTPTLAWDAQVYHLVIGKMALAHGSIVPAPENPPLQFPALVEMLYLAVMVLKSDGAASAIHFGFLLLLCGALFSLSQRFFSARMGWLTVAILCAVPSLVAIATWAYNDLALAFYTFMAFYALGVGQEHSELKWFFLAGGFAGGALGEKYMAMAIPLALALLIARPARGAIKNLVTMLAGCALIAAPWYLRNVAFTGNPIYPLLSNNVYWDAYRAQQLSPPTTLLTTPLFPLSVLWDMTILGMQGTVLFDATMGPLFLMLLPFLALVWLRGDRVTTSALIFAATLYVFWIAELALSSIALQTRYLFFIFPMCALLAALAFERLSLLTLPQFSLAHFASLALLLVLTLTLWGATYGFVALNPLPYLFGTESREEYLKARLQPSGYYAALQFLDELPPHSKVLFLWEPRDYYVSRAVTTQSDWILDQFGHWRYLYHDPDGIAQALRQQGFTHLFINRWGLDYQLSNQARDVSPEMVLMLQDLTTRYAQQVYGELPITYVTDASGKNHVMGATTETYAVYEIK